MRTSVRTIMNARRKQRKTSLVVQGFKCQEVGYKKYLKAKNRLEELYKREPEFLGGEVTTLIERLREEVKEYEKKNNIKDVPKKKDDKWINVKEHPEFDPTRKHGLMDKVRSLFNRGKR